MLIYASIHACRTTWSAAKHKLEHDGINKTTIGHLDFFFLLSYGISNLLFGKLGDEINLRIFISIGLFFTVFSYGLIGLFGYL